MVLLKGRPKVSSEFVGATHFTLEGTTLRDATEPRRYNRYRLFQFPWTRLVLLKWMTSVSTAVYECRRFAIREVSKLTQLAELFAFTIFDAKNNSAS